MRRLLPCSLPFLLGSLSQCREPPKTPPAQDPAQIVEAMRKAFRAEGIVHDEKARTVSVPAAVNVRADPLEYLLIHRKGKGHEALFVTKVKPSVLNGALLLLGLEAGSNADYKEKDPPPTLDEIEKGADPVIVIPPKGKPFWITVKWKDDKGAEQEVAVEDLLLELSTGKPVGLVQWVFLGGRMAPLYKNEPEVFVADFEGNLVSVCYLLPSNHLATMVHERARDDQNWWRTDLTPEVGTEVTVVFHRDQPKVCAERDARVKAEEQKAKDETKDKGKEGGGGEQGGKGGMAPSPRRS